MRSAVLLAIAVLAAPPAAAAAAPAREEEEDAADERPSCASEEEVLERRRKLFEAQGLSPSEIARRNQGQQAALAECRERLRLEERQRSEEQADLAEVSRRAGANATELERNRAWREVRRERLASRSPSSLSKEEQAELAAGMGEEMAATHRALDDAHARDPWFMRVVHSALACYHGERRDVLRELISSEESLLKIGTGDRQKLYALRSELSQSEAVLDRSHEAARSLPAGLERCTSPTVAVVAHCIARLHAKREEPACEAEDIQQYVRFVK